MKPISQWSVKGILEIVRSADRKTLVRYGVIGGAGLLILVFVVWPAWITRFEIKQKIKTIEEQMVSVETLSKSKPILMKNKEQYTKLLKEAKARLFLPGEASLLLGDISKLANEANVVIISSSPKEGGEKFPAPFDKQYEASLYSFTVEGGYHQLGEFVAKLEGNPKILRIQEFDISSPKEKEGGQTLSASLMIAAISAKEQSAEKKKEPGKEKAKSKNKSKMK